MEYVSRFMMICLIALFIFSCEETSTTEPPDNTTSNPPAFPHPEDGEDSVSVYAFLSWSHASAVANPLTYDVYLGASENPPLVASNLDNKFYFPETLEDGVTYYWKVVTRDNQGLTTPGPQWQFHTYAEPGNHSPAIPSDPWPEDDATGIAPGVTFTWTCSDPDSDALSYHIYWGTSENLGNFVRDLDTTAYQMWAITLNYHHYWKVIAEDEHGAATEGPLWEFDAALGWDNQPPDEPHDPYPPDDTTGIDTILVQFKWECSDPDSDSLSYTIKWGTTTEMTDSVTDLSDTTFVLYSLESGIEYFWQVTARDEHGAQTGGPIWTFWTKETTTLIEIPIINEITLFYMGAAGNPTSYEIAHMESWTAYVQDPGISIPGTTGMVGQYAMTWGYGSGWSVSNMGEKICGMYSLENKDDYSQASIKIYTTLTAPLDGVWLPFNLEFYIDGVKAGEYFVQMNYAPEVYFYLEFPISFNDVKTGNGIPVEFRTNKFKIQSPAPVNQPSLGQTMWWENIQVVLPIILLR